MIQIFLIILLFSAGLIIRERKIVRTILYLGAFSLISSVCFMLLAAPDVAMAEAVVSTFSTIVFIVAFEKYYIIADSKTEPVSEINIKNYILPFLFSAFLFVLFVWAIPGGQSNPFAKDMYLKWFMNDVGGENSVTAIYLGYRVFDTIFEALMLLISIVAIVRLSWHKEKYVSDGKRSDINRSNIASVTVRMICPILIAFGVYLTFNGHFSPGGGFQGGVMIASFFICRYMIYDIYDLRIVSVITLEKLIYALIIATASLFVFSGLYEHFPFLKNNYLIVMNTLIALKVACGFLVIFYRFIALERR